LKGNTIFISINIHFAVLLSFTLLKQTPEMALVNISMAVVDLREV